MDQFRKRKRLSRFRLLAQTGDSRFQKLTPQSIPEEQPKHKPQEKDLEEIMRQLSRVSDPAYLPTVSMNDLYEQVCPAGPRDRRPALRQDIPLLWALPR